jgi:hypothetical protein
MRFSFSMILLLVLVLAIVSKRIWTRVYYKISLVIKYYLVLIENRYDQIIDGDEHRRSQERARREV